MIEESSGGGRNGGEKLQIIERLQILRAGNEWKHSDSGRWKQNVRNGDD